MTRMLTKLFVVSTSLALLGGCARKSSSGSTAGSGTNAEASADVRAEMEKDLVRQIHLMNQLEIRAGELAKQKAQNTAVKQFATRLVQEHRAADERISRIAEQRGVDLPSMEMQRTAGSGSGDMSQALENERGMTPEMHQSMQQMEELRRLRGREFDLAFMQLMVEDHENMLRSMESMGVRVEDPVLQSELSAMTDSVRTHRDLAQSITEKLGGRQNIRGTEKR